MPTFGRGDVLIDGKPYMLARSKGAPGYQRTSLADTPKRLLWSRTKEDLEYGELPDEIEHVDVWDDWSDGYGHPYRRVDSRNTYHWAENFDARWPRQLVHAQAPRIAPSFGDAGGTIRADLQANYVSDVPPPKGGIGAGAVFIQGETAVGAYAPTSATTFDNLLTTSGKSRGRPALFGSAIYFGSDLGTSINGAIQSIQTDLTSGEGLYLGAIANNLVVAGQRMWRSSSVNNGRDHFAYLSSIGAGQGAGLANWSASIPVGNAFENIEDMVSLGDQLFVGVQSGLYAGDTSGTFYNVLADIKNQRHPDNCRELTVHNGRVVVPHIGGILAYQPSQNVAARGLAQEIGPEHGRSPVQGIPRAVAGYGPWLYAGYFTGSQSWLLAGRDKNDQSGEYTWHTLNRLPHVARVRHVHVDSVTYTSGGTQIPNRMWVATDASWGAANVSFTAPLYFWPIPLNNGNPLVQDPFFVPNYNGSARMDFGSEDCDTPGTPKTLKKIEVTADNLAPSVAWLDVYYTLDSGTRTKLGTAASSPYCELYFPSGVADGSFATCQNYVLSLESFTASLAQTPVYRSIAVRSVLDPNSIDQITCQVRIADNLPDRQGGQMPPAATMISDLRALGKKGKPPVVFVDPLGLSQYVKVLNGIDEQIVYQEGTRNPEVVATVKMVVTTFSLN